MKNKKIKEIQRHLKKDMAEAKKGIASDKKLVKSLKIKKK